MASYGQAATPPSPLPAHVEACSDAGAVLRQALRYLPTRVVPALFGLATAPVLTRTLDSSGYGRYTVLVLVAGYASVVFGEWVIAGYQRFILSSDQAERQAAEEALAWTAIVLAAGSVLAVPLLVLWHVDVMDLVAAVSLTWGLTLFQLVVTRLIMAERASLASLVQIAASTARFLVVIGVALASRSAVVVVLATGCCLLLVSSVLIRDRRHPLRRPRARSLQLLASFGGFMIVTSIALNGLSTVDRFLLAGLESTASVGRYSASYLLAEQAVLILPSVFVLAITPRVTSLWETGRRREAGTVTATIALLHLELCLPVVVALAIFGRDITTIAFGPGFAEGTVPAVVAVSAVFLALSTYANLGLRMEKRTRRQALQSVTALALNVVLVLLLVPHHGVTGAALATLVAYAVVAAWSLIDNRWFIAVSSLLTGLAAIVLPGAALLVVYAVVGRAPILGVAIAAYAILTANRIFRRLRVLLAQPH